jgi:hypothetical protein
MATALEFVLPDGKTQVVASGNALHHPDGTEIQTEWVDSPTAADLEFHAETLRAYAMCSLAGPRFLRVANGAGWLEYRALPVFYANELSDLDALSTLQRLAAPQPVTGVVDGEWLRYSNAYGAGVDYELRATPRGVQEWLQIASAASLPRPNTLISAGGQTLEVSVGLTLSAGLKARVRSGELSLDLSASDEHAVSLVDAEGKEAFALRRPYAVDAAGNTVMGRIRFRRGVNGLQVSSSYPLNWLRAATFPSAWTRPSPSRSPRGRTTLRRTPRAATRPPTRSTSVRSRWAARPTIRALFSSAAFNSPL